MGVAVAVLVATAAALAREGPPPPTTRVTPAGSDAACAKLTTEVEELEARRTDYEEIDAAGNRLVTRVTLPTGDRVYDQIQKLLRERKLRPEDPDLEREYRALRKLYIQRMTELIPEEANLTRRGIRNYGELKARYAEAGERWRSVEARYKTAKDERDRQCFAMEVDFFDANPQFLPDELVALLYGPRFARAAGEIPLPAGSLEARIAIRSGFTERIGVVADGESRILIRVRTRIPGEVVITPRGRPGADFREFKAIRAHTMDKGDWHLAFYLYTPPEAFGPSQATPDGFRITRDGRRFQLNHRPIDLDVVWKGPNDVTVSRTATLWLLRPPVVLVHGTYDAAKSCWDWGPDDVYYKEALRAGHAEYQTTSFKQQLEDRGFLVFAVNYVYSNGRDPTLGSDRAALGALVTQSVDFYRRSSHFKDNAKVIWHGRRSDHADPGEGIEAALDLLRKLRIAATRADVVGHSMGGVLARVYAKGEPLGQEGNPPDYARSMYPPFPRALPETGWYQRRNNWFAGDINRLITIGSTHKGSLIPKLLTQYQAVVPRPLWVLGNFMAAGSQFSPGAFTDQIPGSAALGDLGATVVPAHAIAGVATVKDLDKFGGLDPKKDPTYRARMTSVFWPTPWEAMRPIFAGHTGSDADGRELNGLLKVALDLQARKVSVGRELGGLRSSAPPAGVVLRALDRIAALERQEADLQREIDRASERLFLKYVAATFYNDWTDFTVSLDSQLGGFREGERWTTVLPHGYRTAVDGVLHGFEPRHREVQATVIKLLEGGLDRFNRAGFPASTLPRYFEPSQARFRPHLLECPAAPRLCASPR